MDTKIEKIAKKFGKKDGRRGYPPEDRTNPTEAERYIAQMIKTRIENIIGDYYSKISDIIKKFNQNSAVISNLMNEKILNEYHDLNEKYEILKSRVIKSSFLIVIWLLIVVVDSLINAPIYAIFNLPEVLMYVASISLGIIISAAGWLLGKPLNSDKSYKFIIIFVICIIVGATLLRMDFFKITIPKLNISISPFWASLFFGALNLLTFSIGYYLKKYLNDNDIKTGFIEIRSLYRKAKKLKNELESRIYENASLLSSLYDQISRLKNSVKAEQEFGKALIWYYRTENITNRQARSEQDVPECFKIEPDEIIIEHEIITKPDDQILEELGLRRSNIPYYSY